MSSMTVINKDRWFLAPRLRRLVANLGYTHPKQAADAIGMNYQHFFKIYWGQRQPSTKTLKRILSGLGVTETDLLLTPNSGASD